jgi:hypothetical protein
MILTKIHSGINKRLVFYERGHFPFVKKLVIEKNEATRFEDSEAPKLRILKSIGFKYAICNDGRKLLRKRGDIADARAMLLRKMHEIRQAGGCKRVLVR